MNLCCEIQAFKQYHLRSFRKLLEGRWTCSDVPEWLQSILTWSSVKVNTQICLVMIWCHVTSIMSVNIEPSHALGSNLQQPAVR